MLTLWIYAGFCATVTILGVAVALPAIHRTPALSPHRRTDTDGAPAAVAVVVAAKDEAATIEPALVALASGLDARMRLVVVDDRSSDETGAIAQRVATGDPRIQVLRIDELPTGWLGKNHALHQGALRALEGPVQFIAFTDADVHFKPRGVRAAVEFATAHELDHLTGGPAVDARGFALQGMIATFGVLFALFTRPWRAADPQSKAYVGIGALNLVRAETYRHLQGHSSIRLRIDDDVRLGQLFKSAGARCAFVRAKRIARVEWYPNLRAMASGLVKNLFAGIEFRASFALAATIALTLGCIVPPLLALAPGVDPLLRAMFGLTSALQMIGASMSAREADLPLASGLFFPLGVALFLGMLLRSMLTALCTGQVSWRGTSYDLSDLKQAARR